MIKDNENRNIKITIELNSDDWYLIKEACEWRAMDYDFKALETIDDNETLSDIYTAKSQTLYNFYELIDNLINEGYNES